MALKYSSNKANTTWQASFHPAQNLPLDDRTVVEKKEDLTNVTTWGSSAATKVYKGLQVFCEEDNNTYIFIGDSISDISNTKSWKKRTGIIQVDSPSDIENIENPEIGEIVYIKNQDEYWYLKEDNVWGVLNNIVVSETEPSKETLWIDPTGDSEINKEGNLINIRQSLKTLQEQMSQVIKIIQSDVNSKE